MKCPYCKEVIEKVKVLEGKFFAESVNNTGFEKRIASASRCYVCPKCDTILSITAP